MLGNTYGLDLGTYEIKIYDKKLRDLYKVKDTIAIKDKKYIIALGDEAYGMYEKVPKNIEVLFPMKEGVISRFNDMQHLLTGLLKNGKKLSRGSDYVIAVPTDITEVDKKAFYDLMIHSTAKARSVSIVDRGVADAVGFGLDVKNLNGIFVVNIGAETTELSIISYGGIVINKLIKKGGSQLDFAIQSKIRQTEDFLIGRLSAESLRKNLEVFDSTNTKALTIVGRNLLTGIPEQRDISVSLARAAIKELIEDYVKEIKFLIERTPPDIARTIKTNGIYLSGGIGNMQGIDNYLSVVLGLPVTVANKPELNAIKGVSKIIHSKELKSLTYSMIDGSYRWIR